MLHCSKVPSEKPAVEESLASKKLLGRRRPDPTRQACRSDRRAIQRALVRLASAASTAPRPLARWQRLSEPPRSTRRRVLDGLVARTVTPATSRCEDSSTADSRRPPSSTRRRADARPLRRQQLHRRRRNARVQAVRARRLRRPSACRSSSCVARLHPGSRRLRRRHANERAGPGARASSSSTRRRRRGRTRTSAGTGSPRADQRRGAG
mgnify:CR=1 FL=1